jgi:hypothetical protein
MTLFSPSDMPKNKSKRQGAKTVTNGNDVDDLDKMLAEVTSADSQLSAILALKLPTLPAKSAAAAPHTREM